MSKPVPIAVREKAEVANLEAYHWASVTYPGLDLTKLPLKPNRRLSRAIARIILAPQANRHLEYTPDYFAAVSSTYCVRVLEHEYTHYACYLRSPEHSSDGDPVFEQEIAKHHLESNYNHHWRDETASRIIGRLLFDKQQARLLKPHLTPNQRFNHVLLAGHGWAIVCGYCGRVIEAWSRPKVATIEAALHHAACSRCQCNAQHSYLVQLLHPITAKALQRWATHYAISQDERASFQLAELFARPATHERFLLKSRLQVPDIANYDNFDRAKPGQTGLYSRTHVPGDKNYRPMHYHAGRGWD